MLVGWANLPLCVIIWWTRWDWRAVIVAVHWEQGHAGNFIHCIQCSCIWPRMNIGTVRPWKDITKEQKKINSYSIWNLKVQSIHLLLVSLALLCINLMYSIMRCSNSFCGTIVDNCPSWPLARRWAFWLAAAWVTNESGDICCKPPDIGERCICCWICEICPCICESNWP